MFIQRSFLRSSLQKGLSFAGLTLGLMVATTALAEAEAKETVQLPNSETTSRLAAAPAGQASLKDGTYLYGESSQPGKIQQEYFVFEVNDNQVVGAAYMPRSGFDCFYGNLSNSKLDLTVISSFHAEAYPHSVNLQVYEPVAQVSENDQRLLATCKADLANTWQAQR